MPDPIPDRCARCGRALDPEDCFVVGDAGLCRTEHIVAWVLRGGAPEGRLTLVRRRMGREIAYDFASAEELRRWASAGGAFGG